MVLFLLVAIPAFPATTLPNVGIGYEIDIGDTDPVPDRPLQDPGLSRDHPMYLRVKVRWPVMVSAPTGRIDWSRLDRIVRQHNRAGYRMMLSLLAPESEFLSGDGGEPTLDEAQVEDWAEWVRAVAGRYRRQVDSFGILDEPYRPGDDPWRGRPAEYGFIIKKGSVAVRSEHPGARIGIGTGGDPVARLKEAYSGDLAPYVDFWLLQPAAGESANRLLESAETLSLQVDPAARIRIAGVVPTGVSAEDKAAEIVAGFLASAGRGAAVTYFRLSAATDGTPDRGDLLLRLHALFRPEFVRIEDAPDTVRFQSPSGDAERPGWYRFFDSERFRVLVGYFPERPDQALATIDVVLDTWDVADLILHDPVSGRRTVPQLYLPDRASNTTSVNLPLGPGPLVLEYRRFATPDLERREEELEVGGRRLLSVEEIIARHQEVQAGQDARLNSFIADAEITFHYQIRNSQSIVDLTYLSTFLFEREVGAEWIHRQLLWNGVTYKGKKIPNLPFVEPERVVSLPLELNLTQDYEYRLAGTERVDGRETYVVSFTPRSDDRSLSRGKIWIDRDTFVRLEVSSVQTGLEAPNISNQEKDRYRPVETGEDEFWLLDRVDGQQILTVSGRNLVILREISFSNFRVNPDDLDQVRQQAYESDAQILRDTPDGFRFLEKQKDGTRVLQEEMNDRTIFWLAGVFFNEALDYPVPLAGFNYFDFNLGNSNAQLELFTAVAFNFINITDPDLFGGPFEGGVDVGLSALKFNDRYFVGDIEVEPVSVRERSQDIDLLLAYPFGDYFKITGLFGTEYTDYSRGDDTGPGFVLPQDTFTNSLELRGEFHLDRWSIEAFGRSSRRSGWEIWGVDDINTPAPTIEGTSFSDFDPSQEDFLKYGGTVSRQWFLPLFQKIRVEASWLQGEDLDRLSKFQFATFGRNRLRGFGGSGVRFDQGGIGRLQYSFNIAEVIRFDAFLEGARVRDRTLSTGRDYQQFTGVGLAGNFVLPRGFIVNFDYGIAVQSDIDGLEGEQEIQLFLLRIY
jgi:hypothetical protein